MKNIIIISVLILSFSVYAQDRKLQVESNHSTVGFKISIAGFTKVTGKFTDYKISLDWNDPESIVSKISIVIQVASIDTGIPDRDNHLQSPDFFDVAKYRVITFESDSIQKINYSHFEVFGKLTMHGVTKNFVLPVEIIKMDGNTIGFKSHTTLNRLDFGIGSEFKHTSMPNFLSNIIELEIDFWTKERKE